MSSLLWVTGYFVTFEMSSLRIFVFDKRWKHSVMILFLSHWISSPFYYSSKLCFMYVSKSSQILLKLCADIYLGGILKSIKFLFTRNFPWVYVPLFRFIPSHPSLIHHRFVILIKKGTFFLPIHLSSFLPYPWNQIVGSRSQSWCTEGSSHRFTILELRFPLLWIF